MSRLIKVIDNETIEIADYRCPEVIFKNSQTPPTLQNIKDEIEHLEWYCTFKDTINPFQMYEENKRLNNIINEFDKWLNIIPNYFMDRRSNNTGVYVQKGMQQMIDMCKNKLQELKGEKE